MLNAEVKTKAEKFALRIYIVRCKSLLPISLNILDSRNVLNNGFKMFDNGFEMLTNFF